MKANKRKLLSNEKDRLLGVKNYIDSKIMQHITIGELAVLFGYSRSTLQRHFYSEFKLTIADYVLKCRLDMALSILQQESTCLSKVPSQVGFRNRTAFSNAFKLRFGCLPSSEKVKEIEN